VSMLWLAQRAFALAHWLEDRNADPSRRASDMRLDPAGPGAHVDPHEGARPVPAGMNEPSAVFVAPASISAAPPSMSKASAEAPGEPLMADSAPARVAAGAAPQRAVTRVLPAQPPPSVGATTHLQLHGPSRPTALHNFHKWPVAGLESKGTTVQCP